MLKVKELTVRYGGALILDRVSIEVGEGDIVVVMGPNGAGKTTLLRAISGLTKLTEGTVEFNELPLHTAKPYEIVKVGISQCPQGRKLFPCMTVMENLLIGAYLRRKRREVEVTLKQVLDLFPSLKAMTDRLSGTLSGGEQQMLAIGRALMAVPRLLLLDEPSEGLSPLYKTKIVDVLQTIRETGVSILLVEQDVTMAFSVAPRAYVLEGGKIAMAGTSDELSENEHVRAAYLGL